MSLETLLVLFVGVTVLSFVMQCIAIWMAARSISNLTARVEAQSDQIEGKIVVIQDRVMRLSEDLQPLRQTATELSGTLQELSGRLSVRSKEVDSLVGDLMDLGREQASKIDYVVADTVQKFEETTSTIQKDLLRPAVEISAFVKGIRAGLEALFSRPPKAQKKAVGDDQLFI